jgi:type IV conjugative transfer system coupling protein TraD
MARVSVWRHVAVSLLLGVLLGGAWFHTTLRPVGSAELKDYIACHIAERVKGPQRRGSYRSLAEGEWTHQRACRALGQRFGGRSLGFLARQAGVRVVVCAAVVVVVLAVVLVGYGRRLRRHHHLRGCQVVDAVGKRRRRLAARLSLALALGVVLSGAYALWELGTERAGLLDDYVATWLSLRIPTLGRWLSASFDGALLWYAIGDSPGFREPEQMLSFFDATFAQRGPMDLVAALGTRSVAIAAVLAAAVARRWPSGTQEHLALGAVQIPRRVESYHMFFCGSPGSGKSTAIKELLDQIRARGEPAIVYDCSGEYLEPFCRPGHDIILNPLDARSARWSPWADAQTPEHYYSMGRALFPQGGKDPFWADAGAQLFAHTVEALANQGQCTNGALSSLLLDASPEQLRKALSGTPAARLVDKAAGAMPQNLLATVTSKLSGWRVLPDPDDDKPPFSIREYVESTNDDRWLFLTTRQDQHDTLRPMLSLWGDIAAGAILSRPPAQDDRLWLVLDELASLQRLPALPQLLERGRKHGAAAILGLQSISQLRAVYGRDGAAALASQPQTWLVLRTVEPETARWLEDALGAAEQQETLESVSMGVHAARDGVSLQERQQKRSAVMAAEIMNLPDLVGYLNLPGPGPIQRIRCRIRRRERLSEAHAPRAR